MNFPYDDIVHALQNTMDLCINSTTDRRGYVLEHRFTTQCNGITPFKVTDFGTNRKLVCDFLLVINTNLASILHRFRDIAFDRSKIAIFRNPSCV